MSSERPGITFFEVFRDICLTVSGKMPIVCAVWSEVINSPDVVVVTMGDKEGFKGRCTGINNLLSKVRAAVNENV